jgi:hypothetical protein
MKTRKTLRSLVAFGALLAASLFSLERPVSGAADGPLTLRLGVSSAHAGFIADAAKWVWNKGKEAVKAVGSVVQKGAEAIGLGGVGKALWGAAQKVGSGVKWVAGKVWEAVKYVGGKVMDGIKWVGGKLLEIALPILQKVKSWISNNLPWLGRIINKVVIPTIEKVIKAVRQFVPEIGIFYDVVKTGYEAARQIVAALSNPRLVAGLSRSAAVDKLTDVAMTAISKLIRLAYTHMVKAALGLAKKPVCTAVATEAGAALAVVTLGIGAVATPLIEQILERIYDFLVDVIKAPLADLAYSVTPGLLKTVFVRSIVDVFYDPIMKQLGTGKAPVAVSPPKQPPKPPARPPAPAKPAPKPTPKRALR